MSRRFRDPPSSASGVCFTRGGSHPSPAPRGRSSRFQRPSPSTQQATTTPGTSKRRIQDKSRLTDDIEASFPDDASASSPHLPSRAKRFPSVLQTRERERIDDYDDHSPTVSLTATKRAGRASLLQEVEDDDGVADLEFLERLRGTRLPASSRESDIGSSSNESESFITPDAASRKRRRLNNRIDHDFNNNESPELTQHIPNPPRVADKENKEEEEAEDPHNPHPLSSSVSLTSDFDIPSPTRTGSSRTLRFKIAARSPFHPTAAQTIHTSSIPTPASKTHKPFFRPPTTAPPHPSDPSPAALPAAFSPSHRSRGRGKGQQGQGYLPGGAAETVRDWVLGLGGQEAVAGKVEKVQVSRVLGRDAGGRYVLVEGDGGRGRLCLVGGESGGSSTNSGLVSTTTGKRVEVGRVIGVRMGWDIDLGLSREQGMSQAAEGGDQAAREKGMWKVVVLWDVLDGQ